MLTLAKYKRFLNIPSTDTSKDTFLQECIDDAIGEANSQTDRKLAYSSHTEYLDGRGGVTLVLNQYPVESISVLQYWDGSSWVDIVSSPDTVSDSIIITGAIVTFIKSYSFFKGTKNIKVTYTAGYLWADEWITSHSYIAGDLVVTNNALYVCLISHVSGTFATDLAALKWAVRTVEVVPADLEKAIKYNAAVIWFESPAGKSIFGKSSETESVSGITQSSTSWDIPAMRTYYQKTYDLNRSPNI